MMEPDDLLVAGLRRGDPASAERLLARFAKPVLNLVAATVRDRHAAEDVAQESLAAAVRGIGSFREGSFSGWLFRIARNRALNYVRDRGREVRTVAEAVVAGGTDPAAEAEREELRSVLRAALESLSAEDQEVLALVDLNGMSYREAAEVVEVNEKALSVRLARARMRLKEAVRQRMAVS